MDELLGKGLSVFVLSKFVVLTSAHLVLLALPLAVLLSSIMTMGNLAENSELVAMKASGLSLIRILKPIIVGMFLLAVGAFFFANNVLPVANLKFKSLLWDITQKKPALSLDENIFYNGIEGYSIRVGKKLKNNRLRDVLIYDHSTEDLAKNKKVIRAERGKMEKTPDGRYLLLTLHHGVSYDESVDEKKEGEDHPMITTTFEKQVLRFDLMGFKLQRTSEDLFKNNNQMLNLDQLYYAKDSLKQEREDRDSMYRAHLKKYIWAKEADTQNIGESARDTFPRSSPFQSLSNERKLAVLDMAIKRARELKGYAERSAEEIRKKEKSLRKLSVEIHRKFTFPLACLVLFFIGAPLGALTKKGGFGMPVIFSILFFLAYHMLSITGEKMAESGKIEPALGMWLATLVLGPLAIFLTYKASLDSQLLHWNSYSRFFRNLFKSSGKE